LNRFAVLAGRERIPGLVRVVYPLMPFPVGDVQVLAVCDSVEVDHGPRFESLQSLRDSIESRVRVAVEVVCEQIRHDVGHLVDAHPVVIDVRPEADEYQAGVPVEGVDVVGPPELGLNTADPHSGSPRIISDARSWIASMRFMQQATKYAHSS